MLSKLFLAHLRCAPIMEWQNQGCRCAPPLATVPAAFQAAFGTLKACREGSLACEQSEPRQVTVLLKTAPRQGCEDWESHQLWISKFGQHSHARSFFIHAKLEP